MPVYLFREIWFVCLFRLLKWGRRRELQKYITLLDHKSSSYYKGISCLCVEGGEGCKNIYYNISSMKLKTFTSNIKSLSFYKFMKAPFAGCKRLRFQQMRVIGSKTDYPQNRYFRKSIVNAFYIVWNSYRFMA